VSEDGQYRAIGCLAMIFVIVLFWTIVIWIAQAILGA